jgi:hypothetical protein
MDSAQDVFSSSPPCTYNHKRSSTVSTDSGLTFALQALLSRHESYVEQTQQENDRLSSRLTELETERATLQDANEKVVAENRDLLIKLDTLNKSYSESDSTVKSLEALLHDTELEVRRLNALARRAEELEIQVHDMERERSVISRKLQDTEQESKSALTRWRESEKRLRQLELEVEKIEWEAKIEMQKHEEVVSRLEKERLLERELGGAEGRLKGAAALQGIQTGQKDNVVSHFVRDILQDNANLQAGIVELRELLQSSNDEVQNLRQQIMHHQPVSDAPEPGASSPATLDQQLAWDQPPPADVQREVHVHHHYHAKLAAKGARTPSIRKRPGRKTVMPGYIGTPESSVPSTPTSRPSRYVSSPVVPLHLHHPQPKKNNRWSVQSAATMSSTFSSLPSSPRSYFDRYSSIFDRIDQGEDSSRPTSPDSVSYVSPLSQVEAPFLKPSPLEASEPIPEHNTESLATHAQTPPLEPEAVITTPATVLRTQRSPDLTPKQSLILTPEPSQPIDITPKHAPDATVSVLSSPQVEPLAPETQSIPNDFIPDDHDTPSPTETPTIEKEIDDFANPGTPPPPATDEEPPFPASPAAISIRPSIRRSNSADSLVSISGMDIHIAKRNASKNDNLAHLDSVSSGRIRSYFTPSQLPPTINRTIRSTRQPLTSIASIEASASQFNTLSSTRGSGEGRRGLESIAKLPLNAGRTASDSSSPTTSNATGIGRIGGWVRSKWGVAPTRSTGDLRSVSASHAIAASRPPLATLLEAPALETATENRDSSKPDADSQEAQTEAHQRSPPRDIPARDRPVSILTSSSASSSALKRGQSLAGTGSLNFSLRTTGINQKGPIPGLWLPTRAPSQVEVSREAIDENALREGLGSPMG